jgi:hypothetical protein
MTIGITALVIQNPEQHYNKQLYCNSGSCFVQDIRFLYGLSDNSMGEQLHLEAILKGDFYNLEDWGVLVRNHEEQKLPEWYKSIRYKIENEFKIFIKKEIEKTEILGYYDGSIGDFGINKNDKNIILPKKIKGYLELSFLNYADNIVFPEEIGGMLDLFSLISFKNLILPKKINGRLLLYNIDSIEGLVLPDGCTEVITREILDNKYSKKVKLK